MLYLQLVSLVMAGQTTRTTSAKLSLLIRQNNWNFLSSCNNSVTATKTLPLTFILMYGCTQCSLLFLRFINHHITIMSSSSEDISRHNKQDIIDRSLQCASVKCDWFHTIDCASRRAALRLHYFNISICSCFVLLFCN
jgi:hypothetical protein